jgi:hypothetical protein
MMLLKDYKECKGQIVKLLKRSVHSVYEYGTYKNPGLSDIDLIIVIDFPKKSIKHKVLKIKKKYNFFFEYSNIIIANKNLIKNIKFFDNLNLKKIIGPSIPIKQTQEKDKKILKLLEVIDWAPERVIRLTEIKKNFLIRKNLAFLNSAKYSLKNINYFLKNHKYDVMIKDIDNLRVNYKNSSEKKAQKIFDNLIDYLVQGIDKISKKNYFKEIEKCCPKFASISFPDKSKIFFEAKKRTKVNKSKNILSVPSSFGYPYFYYSHYHPNSDLFKLIHKHYVKNINSNIIFSKNKKLLEILDTRCRTLSENIIYLKKMEISGGLYKFGWFM